MSNINSRLFHIIQKIVTPAQYSYRAGIYTTSPNVFIWASKENQCWITGFNPSFTEPNPYDMVVLGSVNFTGRENMYNDIKNDILNGTENDLKQLAIFDLDNLVKVGCI